MRDENCCDNCKWLIFQDYGYSNYTVEGRRADCIWGANPNLPYDWWYGKDTNLIIKNCARFNKLPAGQGQVTFDVDGDFRIDAIADMEVKAAVLLYTRTDRCIINYWEY